jgi:hypothetical protein
LAALPEGKPDARDSRQEFAARIQLDLVRPDHFRGQFVPVWSCGEMLVGNCPAGVQTWCAEFATNIAGSMQSERQELA